MKSRFSFFVSILFLVLILSACGGKETSSDIPTSQAPETIALSQPFINLDGLSSFGVVKWSDEKAYSGEGSAPIAGVSCAISEEYHIHSHLTILLNGEPQAIPANIGLNGCDYEIHTHNRSGLIHIETSAAHKFTLGQFFRLWKYSLSKTKIADLEGREIYFYVNDGNGAKKNKEDPDDILLLDHREITIIIGSTPSSVPSFIWPANL